MSWRERFATAVAVIAGVAVVAAILGYVALTMWLAFKYADTSTDDGRLNAFAIIFGMFVGVPTALAGIVVFVSVLWAAFLWAAQRVLHRIAGAA